MAAAVPYELDLWASADADVWVAVAVAAEAAEAALHTYRWACADRSLPVGGLADAAERLVADAARIVDSVRQVAHDFAVADMFHQRGYLTWGRGLASIDRGDTSGVLGDGGALSEDHLRRVQHRDGHGRVIGHLSPGQAEFLHDLTAEAFAGTPIAAEVSRLQRGLVPDHDVVAAYDMSDKQIELFLATTWVTLDVGTGSRAIPERQAVRGRRMAAMAWGVSEGEWIAEETASDIWLDYQFPFAGNSGWGRAAPPPP